MFLPWDCLGKSYTQDLDVAINEGAVGGHHFALLAKKVQSYEDVIVLCYLYQIGVALAAVLGEANMSCVVAKPLQNLDHVRIYALIEQEAQKPALRGTAAPTLCNGFVKLEGTLHLLIFKMIRRGNLLW